MWKLDNILPNLSRRPSISLLFFSVIKKKHTHSPNRVARDGSRSDKERDAVKSEPSLLFLCPSRRRCREANVDPTAWVDARGQIQPHDDERWAARSSLNYFRCPTCPHTLPVCCLLPKLIRSAFHVWRKKYFSHVCRDSISMYFKYDLLVYSNKFKWIHQKKKKQV